MRIYSYLIKLHRVTGLLLVIPVLLLSISGSIIVFDHAIDEWLNPDLLLSKPAGPQQPLSHIIDSAMQAVPGTRHINALLVPRHDKGVYLARVGFSPGSPLAGKLIEVMIDPYTAEVKGVREWGTYLTSFIYRFHFTLLLDDNGETLIGILALLLLVNLGLGLYIGWPRCRAAWRWLFNQQPRPSRTLGKWRRRHLAAGLIGTPVLCLSIVTGLSMVFPNVTPHVLASPPAPALTVDATTRHRADPDRWLNTLQRHWPDAQWMRLTTPADSDDPVKLVVRNPGDPRRTTGSSTIWLHPRTGAVLAEQPLQALNRRQQIAYWLFPLHSGEAAGLPGRLTIFVTGLLTTILCVAGAMLWLRRRHWRDVSHSKRATGGSAIWRSSH